MEFDDQVGAEDDALTDSVQRGLRAGNPRKADSSSKASNSSSGSRGWYSPPSRDTLRFNVFQSGAIGKRISGG